MSTGCGGAAAADRMEQSMSGCCCKTAARQEGGSAGVQPLHSMQGGIAGYGVMSVCIVPLGMQPARCARG